MDKAQKGKFGKYLIIVDECKSQCLQAQCELIEIGHRDFSGKSLCKMMTLKKARAIIRFISPLPEKKSKYWSILDVNIKEIKCKFIATHVRRMVNDKRSKLNLLSIRNLSSRRSGFVVTLICTGFIQRDTKVSFVLGFTPEH